MNRPITRLLITCVLISVPGMGPAASDEADPPARGPAPTDPPISTTLVNPPISTTLDSVARALGEAKIYRTYAREDTSHIPHVYVYDEDVRVEAQRVSLEEILARCIEAEKTIFEHIEDLAFTQTENVVGFFGNPDEQKTKRQHWEEVTRVYHKRPDRERSVQLAKREYKVEWKNGEPVRTDEKSEVEVEINDARSGLDDLPFFFEELSNYRFTIKERLDLEDRVFYRIGFVPRSDFDPLPSGAFWIDTTDFRIFRADLAWHGSLPVPLVLKAVDHVAFERKRIGETWVWDRFSARIRLRKLPFVPIPQVIEIVVTFDDYAIDAGLPPGVFEDGDS